MRCFVVSLLITAAALAQAQPRKPAEPPPEYVLTIPSSAESPALIHETRKVDLPDATTTLRLFNFPPELRADTLNIVSLTDPRAAVLDMEFASDVVTPGSLLKAAVGKTIIINRRQTPLPDEKTRIPETIEGKLLAFDDKQLVLQTSNRQLPLQIVPRSADIAEIKFFDQQPPLAQVPTLTAVVKADKPGQHSLRLSYLTPGLSWKTHYTLIVDAEGRTADFSGFASITNATPITFADARLRLDYGRTLAYQRPVTLRANATRHIELVPPRLGVPVKKTLLCRAMLNRVDESIELDNPDAPLPPGLVRVYRRDGDDNRPDPLGSPQPAGQHALSATAKDAPICIPLAPAAGLTATRHAQASGAVAITVRNDTNTPARIIVRDTLGPAAQVQSDLKHTRPDDSTIQFIIDLPPNQQSTLTYTATSN